MSNEIIVNLNDIAKIRHFSQVCLTFESDIDIASLGDPKYIIDAKSVMGVFGLDLSKKAVVKMNSNNESELKKFLTAMQEFAS